MKKILFLLFFGTAITIHSKELDSWERIFKEHYYTSNNWIVDLNYQGSLYGYTQKITPSVYVLPILKSYPHLATIPHIPFFKDATPVKQLVNVEILFPQTSIWMKVEDISAVTGLYSGNKRRKLEFELAQALAQGARTVITLGYAGSYHAIATSEYAKRLGLNCICMLKPEINSHEVRKNLLMHLYNQTNLHYSANNQERKRATIDLWFDYIAQQNCPNKSVFDDPIDYPYIIPTGGSAPLGILGFVNAAFELKEQIDAGILPMPDYIYVACGSVGTTVGLLLGCKAAGLKTKIIAVAIEPEDPNDPLIPQIEKLFAQTNALLHETAPSFAIFTLGKNDYEINRDFTGNDYGLYTREGNNAKKIFYETEQLKLDGSYTAKAASALLHDLQTGKCNGKKVLFWNTYCAYDFSDRIKELDYKKLPECFHSYFEQDVQELDRVTQP